MPLSKKRNNRPTNNGRRQVDIIKTSRIPRPRGAVPRNDYLSCRMNPFMTSKISTGIPDGSNRDYIVMDSRTIDSITCVTNAGFIIQTLPQLPYSSVICGLGTAGNNDISINGIGYNNGPTTLDIDQWYPIGYDPMLAAQKGYFPGTPIVDPYVSTKARIVSIGHKLTYQGTLLNCAGTATVTSNPVAYSTPWITAADSQGYIAGCSQGNTVGVPAGAPVINLECGVNPTSIAKDTLVCRLDNGVTVYPKHASPIYKANPTADIPAYITTQKVISTTDPAHSIATSTTSSTPSVTNGTTVNPGVIFWDDDWTGTQIVVRGIATGASFIWETIFCVEYSVSSISSFAQMVNRSSPYQPRIMDKAMAMTNNKQLAISYGAFDGPMRQS